MLASGQCVIRYPNWRLVFQNFCSQIRAEAGQSKSKTTTFLRCSPRGGVLYGTHIGASPFKISAFAVRWVEVGLRPKIYAKNELTGRRKTAKM